MADPDSSVALPTGPHWRGVQRMLWAGERRGWILAFTARYPVAAHQRRLEMITPDAQRRRNDVKSSRIYACNLALAGSCRVTTGGATLSVTAGSCFQLNAVDHEPAIDHGRGYAEWGLCLDFLTGARLAQLGLWNTGLVHLSPRDPRALLEHGLALQRAIADPAVDAPSLMRRVVRFLDVLYTGCQPMETGDELVRRARELLQERCQPGTSIAEIAASLEVSPDALYRRFRAQVGCSPQHYQLRERMLQAQSLLLEHSEAETAVRLGYRDAFLFSRQFHRQVGMAPSHWREQGGKAC